MFGRWTEEVELSKLSNFRATGNLVMVTTCQILKEPEVFVFMDNKVMERTYLWGLSKGSKLHDCIEQLRKFQMEGNFIIHFIWIAATQMIDQGTNTLSQGELSIESMLAE